VLCVAAGRANMVAADMVKPGAWVIDVGNTQLPSGKWVGDVAFESVSKIAHVTPVPGGVGPMTRAMLLRNTVLAAERQLAAR
jgi:methylenetetrahydrofolate dehydrogenase (NADP+)/methenyltetrahydrofolate cyclohydrolase